MCLPHIDGICLSYMMLLYFVLFYFLFLILFLFYFVVNLMRQSCFSAEVHYCCKPHEAQMFYVEVFISGKPR